MDDKVKLIGIALLLWWLSQKKPVVSTSVAYTDPVTGQVNPVVSGVVDDSGNEWQDSYIDFNDYSSENI